MSADEESDKEHDAWVQCDICSKWRRVSSEISDALDDRDGWTCKDNTDRRFASCDSPQELSDDEIDQILAEQESSEEEEEEEEENAE
eukprot:gene17922-21340_t